MTIKVWRVESRIDHFGPWRGHWDYSLDYSDFVGKVNCPGPSEKTFNVLKKAFIDYKFPVFGCPDYRTFFEMFQDVFELLERNRFLVLSFDVEPDEFVIKEKKQIIFLKDNATRTGIYKPGELSCP